MSDAQTSTPSGGEPAEVSTPATAGGVSAQFAGAASPSQGVVQGQGQTPPEADHSRYQKIRDELQTELNTRAEKISTDPELDEGARHRSLNDLWNAYAEGEMKFGQLYEQELQGIVDEQEQKVFRTPPNLMDSVRSSYSMISNEVDFANIEEGEGFEGIRAGNEKLEQLYDRATRTQDRALMLAVFHLATEKGIHGLRDRHLATSKDLSSAWESYTAARMKLANWTDREENLIQRLDGRRGLAKPPVIR